MVCYFNIFIQFNYHLTIWCNQQCSYVNRNKYSSVMIAQLMLMPLGGWVWLLVLLVNSFRVGLLWTWYWTLGVLEMWEIFLIGWVTVSVPRRTILLGCVGAAERNQGTIDWHSAVLEPNKADQERLEAINSKTSSLVRLTWCVSFIMEQTGGFVEPWFFPYIHLYLLLKVAVTFIRSHILTALLWKIRAFWNLQ